MICIIFNAVFTRLARVGRGDRGVMVRSINRSGALPDGQGRSALSVNTDIGLGVLPTQAGEIENTE